MLNIRKLRQAIKSGSVDEVRQQLRDAGKQEILLPHGWNPLHLAVKHGKQAVIGAILDAGYHVNATTDLWQTPWDVAIGAANKKLAAFLHTRGGKSAAETSLHGAVAHGNLKWVKKHAASGVDPNKLIRGELALCMALSRQHWNVATFLLNKGCEVTKTEADGEAPLHSAAYAGAPDKLLKMILKLGACINHPDAQRRTPLCYAAEAGETETVDWLIDNGADLALGRNNDSTPVYCAIRGERIELASHLIDRGAKSTLHQAVQCNHLARARQQLNAGADANDEKDPHRMESPLEMAIWLDSTEMVTLLLEFNADPNQQDEYGGDTALHDAVRNGSAKMVKLLLAHGADPDLPNVEGLTPIEFAKRRDQTHLANLMDAHIDKKLSLEATQGGIDQLFTVPKVAELLSVDDSFILNLIKARKITAISLDEKTIRIPAGSVQRFLAKLRK